MAWPELACTPFGTGIKTKSQIEVFHFCFFNVFYVKVSERKFWNGLLSLSSPRWIAWFLENFPGKFCMIMIWSQIQCKKKKLWWLLSKMSKHWMKSPLIWGSLWPVRVACRSNWSQFMRHDESARRKNMPNQLNYTNLMWKVCINSVV